LERPILKIISGPHSLWGDIFTDSIIEGPSVNLISIWCQTYDRKEKSIFKKLFSLPANFFYGNQKKIEEYEIFRRNILNYPEIQKLA